MRSEGFTLVELVVALAVSSIIVGAIYSAYLVQDRYARNQERVAEMQQNLRAALLVMAKEIRMAGYDPTGEAGATVTVAQAGQLSFTLDRGDGVGGDPDGDTADANEQIDYGFSPANDADRNGVVDDLDGDGILNDVAPLGRQTGGAGGYQPIAENIQAIEFYYTLANGVQTLTPSQPGQVVAVQVTILARAAQRDQRFVDTRAYVTPSGATWGPYGDNYRRRMASMTIDCRNMGL